MNSSVDWFFNQTTPWQKEYRALRRLVLACGLTEELKWGCPCYTHNGVNVVLIHGFKEYCALLFVKGALLNDTHRLLIQQTKNVQSARQIRFAHLEEIMGNAKVLKAYVNRAVDVEKSGRKVKLKNTSDFEVPEEFRKQLNKSAPLKKAFDGLTPGRQRGYLFYFSQAKQSKTRVARVEKCVPQILKGKGLDD